MKKISEILYQESGILDLVHSGFEDMVQQSQIDELKEAVKDVNQRMINGEDVSKELIMLIEMYTILAPKSNVDWVKDVEYDVFDIISQDSDYDSEI